MFGFWSKKIIIVASKTGTQGKRHTAGLQVVVLSATTSPDVFLHLGVRCNGTPSHQHQLEVLYYTVYKLCIRLFADSSPRNLRQI